VNLILGFLAQVRASLPPWAQPTLVQTERFLGELRGLPRATSASILLCTALIYLLKAVFMAVLTLLVAACWLRERAAGDPQTATGRPAPGGTP
jgi:hypothetical protein